VLKKVDKYLNIKQKRDKVANNPIKIIFLFMVIFLVGCTSTGQYDNFAKCLSQSGAKMYGAYWCPHCEDQKQMFGNSWQYVKYIECSLPNRGGQNEVCDQADIKAYPTWEFGDGSRQTGTLTPLQLSQLSHCTLQ
jgi:hypothetical protein